MKKISLEEQDLQALQKALNAGEEPPHELAKKLFPSLHESWDFKTLSDARIPTIEYQGKRRRQHGQKHNHWTNCAKDWREVHCQQVQTLAEARALEKRIKARGAKRYLSDLGS